MKVKVLKFTKNHGFHGNRHFSRKKANFTANVMAMKSWIKLVPNYVTLILMVAHKYQPSSKDRTHHTNTTTILQQHHTIFLNVLWCHTMRKVVWCGCGVSVMCPVFGQRLALVGHHRISWPLFLVRVVFY